jgi:NAD(P)-dependent dehydrogenase (short-subunit alcohol dehydrogenase family)
MPWTAADVPSQAGRTAVITGGNTGIGFETARVLAERGASVVLACRDPAKAKAAAARIADGARRAGDGGPDASTARPGISTIRLDLASLASVREAADELRDRYAGIDLLINNAGVMDTPHGTTEDGFELQLGVNHLGHFALTGLLLDRMLHVSGARIVTVSSLNHTDGRIDFDDLQSERRYRRTAAYAQSKLANLLFTYELDRRLTAAGAQASASAAHPGFTRTELGRSLPGWLVVPYQITRLTMAHSAAKGALPTLRAATDPDAPGGGYYGPAGGERGFPERVSSHERSHDEQVQRRLWEESQRLTGVSYAALARSPG